MPDSEIETATSEEQIIDAEVVPAGQAPPTPREMPATAGSTVSYTYDVFSADPVFAEESAELPSGEQVTVKREILSVQLISDEGHGSITLRVTHPEVDAHPFEVGEHVTLTIARGKKK